MGVHPHQRAHPSHLYVPLVLLFAMTRCRCRWSRWCPCCRGYRSCQQCGSKVCVRYLRSFAHCGCADSCPERYRTRDISTHAHEVCRLRCAFRRETLMMPWICTPAVASQRQGYKKSHVPLPPPCTSCARTRHVVFTLAATSRVKSTLTSLLAMLPGAPRPGGVRFSRAGSTRTSSRWSCTPYRAVAVAVAVLLLYTLSRLLSKKPTMNDMISSDEVASMLLARAEAAEKKAAVRPPTSPFATSPSHAHAHAHARAHGCSLIKVTLPLLSP